MTQKVVTEDNGMVNAPSVELFSGGINNAISGLSRMVDKEIKITGFNLKRVQVKDVADLFGGPETLLVGVYLEVSGFTCGHIILAYQPETAFELVDMLLDQPAETTTDLTEMGQSVLGEVGNIMGSFFLNHLSDSTGVTFLPSPPAVMMDMAGAILDVALAQILEQSDDTYVVETSFGTHDRQVSGTLLLVPVPDIPDIKDNRNDNTN